MEELQGIKRGSRANRVLIGVFLAYVTIGAVFYHLVEKWSWLDSIYFTVITLATVGYGDFTPKTDPGKIFTIFYIFIGIGLFIFTANNVLKNRVEYRASVRTKKGKSKV